jgi:outer membrane protein OmpA-like peptidoglycan-associated protein
MAFPTEEFAMRRHALLAAIGLLAAGILAPATGEARSDPSPDEIIKSLTPTTGPSGATRGLRIRPAQPGQAQPPAPQPAISLTVQFATGSADLSPQAIGVLDNLGKALSDQALVRYRFRIEGHTDTVGTHGYNKELSDRRAAAVVDYLANNFHVDRGRVEAVGMGEDRLLIPTPDQTPEPRNRRVLVVNIGS